MSRRLTQKETVIRKRARERNALLEKTAVIGYKRPEDFPRFEDEVKPVKKKKTK